MPQCLLDMSSSMPWNNVLSFFFLNSIYKKFVRCWNTMASNHKENAERDQLSVTIRCFLLIEF